MTSHPEHPSRAWKAALAALVLFAALPIRAVRAADEPIIPPHAWMRPIGQAFVGAGRPKTNYRIIDDGPTQGAPLGGIGAGTIGRDFTGGFSRWHLETGTHRYRFAPADMFSVYTRQGQREMAQTLYAGKADRGETLGAWGWEYPVGGGTYWALYPRSGFVYDALPIQLSVEQFSPIIPGDYRAASYPVALFTYTATNPTADPVTVGLMFTWQNMSDSEGRPRRSGLVARIQSAGDLTGIMFTGAKPNTSVAIAAERTPGVTPGTFVSFDPGGDGAAIWRDFAADGALNDSRSEAVTEEREGQAAGVSATFTLAPGESRRVPFYLAWDFPEMPFGWYKRYTAFFGRQGDNAWEIITEAAKQREAWHQAILNWQTPILDDSALPGWYKTALFNELYYLADGGAAWEHGRVGEAEPPPDYLGRFALLECFDYPFYNTFDVDFYASFALMRLWPELEKRTMSDFAATVELSDLRLRRIQASGQIAPRKLAGAIPHDLGSPGEKPWDWINAFNWQDVNRWKDLNAKFVLRLYRDTLLLHDTALAQALYPAAKRAMEYLAAMDRDGDGIPENEGIPDQTYDTWPAQGISAYSGGLWIAALRAMVGLAERSRDTAAARQYEAMLSKAREAYENALWTGSYYKYDTSASYNHDSIMADQLAGEWYLNLSGEALLSPGRVKTALQTIYQKNVKGFMGGEMGAVNGARPDGNIDLSSEQSQEVWTGVSYAVASLMLRHGLVNEAWATARGVYLVTYEKYGYWFRTPEAYDKTGNFRASIYLRPLAIWAIQIAHEQRAGQY